MVKPIAYILKVSQQKLLYCGYWIQLSVQRCGMIYMEPQQLGWTPLRHSYMNTLPESLSTEHRELVRMQTSLDQLFFVKSRSYKMSYICLFDLTFHRLWICLIG